MHSGFFIYHLSKNEVIYDMKHNLEIIFYEIHHQLKVLLFCQPFSRFWNATGSDGQGVIGMLEANFVELAHDK